MKKKSKQCACISERILMISTYIIYFISILIYEIGICNENKIQNMKSNPSRIILYIAFMILLKIFIKKFLKEAIETFNQKSKKIAIVLYVLLAIISVIYVFPIWKSIYPKATYLICVLMGFLFLLYVSSNYIKNTIVLTFTLALVYTFSTNFHHGLDEKKHMMSAINVAAGHFNYIKEPLREPAFNDIIFNCEMESFSKLYKVKYESELTKEWNITEDSKLYYICSSPAEYNPILYLPSATGILYTKLLGGSIADAYITARLFNLIAYSTLVVIILKILPYKKKVFFLVCMIPFTLVLSCTLSVDGICIGIIGIFISYCLRLLEMEVQKIKLKQIIILMVLFLFCLLVKDMAYSAILLFVFVLPILKILKNNKKVLPIIIIMSIIALIICALFAMQKISSTSSSGGDPRGGETSFKGQLEYLKNNPINIIWIIAGIFTNFMFSYNWYSYLNNGDFFGKYYSQLFFIQLLFILYYCVTDNSAKMKKRTRIVSILTFFATLFTTCMMLYLTFTPVGELYVAGYQPRYITPIISLLLITISSNRFIGKSTEKEEKIIDTNVAIILGAVTFVELFFLINA